ncbi:MAG TPA: TIGR03087 family PEP-CTERM/XrtA system glycosyltransferase [Candidatus Eisenbacteria bacterium]|nr:TIGR03087 family PEP-CTERM/XrtA system glycosyltransferase [Candidatus Eisenbacteria bacterium]
MRILYLAHRVPFPPDKGEKIRAYHQIAHLAPRHAIHLLALADTPEDVAHAASLRPLCASVDVVYRSRRMARLHALAALPSARSLSVAAFDSSALRRLVRKRLADSPPDAIVAYTCPMAAYVADVAGIPRLLDFVDLDSAKWRAYAERLGFPRSLVYNLEADRLARYEASMATVFEASTFVSDAEANLLRPLVPGRSIGVLPMGVDLDYFRPEAVSGPDRPAPPPSVVFTGVMDYFPNTDAVRHFALDVLPALRRLVPDATFTIVGRRPTPEVRDLARLEGVRVTGEVPDVRPYFTRARAAVAPFRIARGVQSKILEAMAMGLPVVSAPLALQGIPAGEGDGVRRAADPEAFAAALAPLLTDDDLWRREGSAARRYVERRHPWSEAGRMLEELLAGIVSGRSGAASDRAARATS